MNPVNVSNIEQRAHELRRQEISRLLGSACDQVLTSVRAAVNQVPALGNRQPSLKNQRQDAHRLRRPARAAVA